MLWLWISVKIYPLSSVQYGSCTSTVCTLHSLFVKGKASMGRMAVHLFWCVWNKSTDHIAALIGVVVHVFAWGGGPECGNEEQFWRKDKAVGHHKMLVPQPSIFCPAKYTSRGCRKRPGFKISQFGILPMLMVTWRPPLSMPMDYPSIFATGEPSTLGTCLTQFGSPNVGSRLPKTFALVGLLEFWGDEENIPTVK